MSDYRILAADLNILATMITMGERIRWGQDAEAMVKASEAIEALQARAEKAEAELREARMQMLSDAGQAAEAYEAQLRAEAQCNAVMKDRAYIMAERDKTFALMLERAEKAEVERLKALVRASLITRHGLSIEKIYAAIDEALAGDAP